MRLFFLLSGIVLLSSVNAQKRKSGFEEGLMPTTDSVVIYSGVVRVSDSASKDILYERAKRFFVEIYKSANDVIQLDDKINGEIIGKGIFKVSMNMGIIGSQPTSVYHTLSIAVKDGRYRYEIKDLIVDYYSEGSRIGSSYIPGNQVHSPIEAYLSSKMNVHRRYCEAVDAEVKLTITALENAMNKILTTKKNDW